jgi:sodium-dependent phosphate cotransporter
MGHFANKEDLRRGFAAATVHDLFNMLSVAVFLPLNW